MQLIVTLAVLALLLFLLPAGIRTAVKSTRGKAGLGGASLAIGIAFAFLFDPPQAAAIENAQKKEEADDEDGDEGADTMG